MIDEHKSRIPCWIVWSTGITGIVTMEAIALTNYRAVTYRKVLLASGRNYVKVTIEATEANHLLAGDMDNLWFKMYGEDAQRRRRDELVARAKRERNTAVGKLVNLWQACAELMPNVERDVHGFDRVRQAMVDSRHIFEEE